MFGEIPTKYSTKFERNISCGKTCCHIWTRKSQGYVFKPKLVQIYCKWRIIMAGRITSQCIPYLKMVVFQPLRGLSVHTARALLEEFATIARMRHGLGVLLSAVCFRLLILQLRSRPEIQIGARWRHHLFQDNVQASSAFLSKIPPFHLNSHWSLWYGHELYRGFTYPLYHMESRWRK